MKTKTKRKFPTLLEIAGALVLAVTLAFGACGTRTQSARASAPQVRASAVQLYLGGATPAEVAGRLSIDPREARTILRATIAELEALDRRSGTAPSL